MPSLTPREHTYLWWMRCQIMIPPVMIAEVQPEIHINHGPESQHNPPHICWTTQSVYHYISFFNPPWEFLGEEEKWSEQQISFKGDADIGDDNRVKVFSHLFSCWYHNTFSTLSLYLLANTYNVLFLSIKTFHLWMRLWFPSCRRKNSLSNSDSNQGAIGEWY